MGIGASVASVVGAVIEKHLQKTDGGVDSVFDGAR